MRRMSPELIIFDCDGVLVDSETVACRVSAECLSEAGFAITTDEVMARYVGVSLQSMLADVETRHERRLPEQFAALLRARMVDAFADSLQPIAGIEALLRALPGRRCVASGNAALRKTLAVAGLLHHFDPHIFDATQVARGKPAPDLFLFAAAQMDVAPAACLVIEDSVFGVQAGVAAGMPVIGFTGAGHCGDGHAERLSAEGAFTVCEDMEAVARILCA